ncbi:MULTISPECIES: amidohydrolase family protein [Micrococcaceae]|jgi:imidazolonepropionase-like amidohydrolase|uniref:amidohydrolase family protein n=1 Tax=Micrococcaceae TaxID=1268 RepID=UPI0012FB6C18|nr:MULTISPECIES: amidohydrolase family protein [Pseudarthrobacter]MUU72089.1 amidohydrolase family protein [Pseudarthrobacter sp. GA104]WPU08904.1 amidohydrolase family protein [Pseudarthrobacter oxydans]HET7783612.1 amidohydrolase family protein [Arthrobacter sp.]
MCLHDHTPAALPSPAVPRRGILAGAAALAGISVASLAAQLGNAPAAKAEGNTAGPGRRGRPASPPPMIIEGGTIVDPQTGDAVYDGVLVLEGGKVSAVGTREETRRAVAALAGRAHVVDASGRWVIPGLIDVHVHANALSDARAILQGGATSVRSGSSSFYQDVALAALPAWAAGASPRMSPAGLFVSPELGDSLLADPDLAPLASLAGGVRETGDLAYLTRVNLNRGAQVIKTRANPRAGLPEQDPRELVYNYDQLSAVVKAAGKAGVLCHAYSAEGIDGAVRAGVRSIEHGVFVTEETISRMSRQGTYFTPTMDAITSMAGSSNPILAARGKEYTPIIKAAVKAAHDAGVTVVAGTDSFGSDVTPIGTEVRLLSEAGLSPLEALRAATVNAAALLGWSENAGRLVPGSFADAVIVDSDPLSSGSALEGIRAVVAQGVLVRNSL